MSSKWNRKGNVCIVLPLEPRYTERSYCRSRQTSTPSPFRHSSLPLGRPRMRKCRWRSRSSWWKPCQASTFQSPPSHNLFHWKHKIICYWHLRTSRAVIIPPKLVSKFAIDDDAKDTRPCNIPIYHTALAPYLLILAQNVMKWELSSLTYKTNQRTSDLFDTICTSTF